ALEVDGLLQGRVETRQSVVSWVHSDPYGRLRQATRLGDAFSKDRAAVYARLLAAQTISRAMVLRSVGVPDVEHPELTGGGETVFAASDAVRALRSVDACLAALDSNVRPRLALQSMVLQWPTE